MAPRPASKMNFCAPTSTSVLGPKRSKLGGGAPVPRSVTRKRSWAVLNIGGSLKKQDRQSRVGELLLIHPKLGLRLAQQGGVEQLAQRRSAADIEQLSAHVRHGQSDFVRASRRGANKLQRQEPR